jgi:hypothetical protein
MKTPNSAQVVQLDMARTGSGDSADLRPGGTLQKVVNFDLKEEGNHVLAVTVSYYEATETSGRTRTFRKLYQFNCRASLVVRTKIGALPPPQNRQRRWVMEAQLENCSDDTIQLERVVLDLEAGLGYVDCNWDASHSPPPNLQPGEAEQVSFVISEVGKPGPQGTDDKEPRLALGVLGVGWRGEMGTRGFLTTGKLGTRI